MKTLVGIQKRGKCTYSLFKITEIKILIALPGCYVTHTEFSQLLVIVTLFFTKKIHSTI